MKYRADIDGLRAFAILPVIFYHLGMSSFPGGFVGVDIFFVISGFLISGIIVDAKQKGTFTYLNFYERRARRLLPSLYTVILCAIIAGYVLLLPNEYNDLFKSSIFSCLFSSNFFFFSSIDYFSIAAEFMPLLHTWSLAVEEQFYIFWPIILSIYLALTRKLPGQQSLILIVLICIISLVLSTIFINDHGQMVFYMTPFRLWELGLGTLITLTMRLWPKLNKRFSSVFFILGLLLCLSSIFLLSKESIFPGINALPVCLGAALLLFYGETTNPKLTYIFRHRITVFIGKISYTLYLWHWVILAFYRTYHNSITLNSKDQIFCLLLSVILSCITWRFIENPIRFKSSRNQFLLFSITASVLILSICLVGVQTKGLAFRADYSTNNLNYATSRDAMWKWTSKKIDIEGLGQNLPMFGADWNTANKRIILWGDSHAEHFSPLLDIVAKENNISIVRWFYAACIDDINVRQWRVVDKGTATSIKAGKQHQKMVTWLANSNNKVDAIILAAAWSGYPGSLFKDNPIDRSKEEGAALVGIGLNSLFLQIDRQLPIIILTDVPRPRRSYAICAHRKEMTIFRSPDEDICSPMPRNVIDSWHNPTTNAIKKAAAEYNNVHVFDMVELMCTDDECPIFLKDKIIYQDTNHLRRNFNQEELLSMIAKLHINDIFNLL